MAYKLSTPKPTDQKGKRKNDKTQRRVIRPLLLTRAKQILNKLTSSRNDAKNFSPKMQTADKPIIRPRKPHNINWNGLHVKDTQSRGKIGSTNNHNTEKANSWLNTVYNTTEQYDYNKFNAYYQDFDKNESNPTTNAKHGKRSNIHARMTKLSDMPAKRVLEYCTGPYVNQSLGEYLASSTLHGLRYVGDGSLSWLERIFWLIAFTLALMCATYFIQNVYRKWSDEPMIVSLNPDPLALTAIPFPAITICNANRARRSVAERILSNGSRVDKKLLEGVCNMDNDSAIRDSRQQQADWNHVKQFLITVTQPCSEMIPVCMWKSEVRVCENLFNTQLTDDGLCCTFNAVHKDNMFRNPRDISDLNITFPFPAVDWTPENGYPADAPINGFPWRPIGPGANLGLTLVLDANLQEYYCSSINSAAFKILLHSPVETPKIAQYGDLVQAGLESRIAVAPRVYDASPQLQTVNLKKRNCLFANELQLVYYRTYTQKNCVLECEARLTLEKCNCSQYYMPKNRSVRICDTKDNKCVEHLKKALDDKLGMRSEQPLVTQADCDSCLPACTELTYTKAMSTGTLMDTFHFNNDVLAGRTREYFKTNMAVLHFYFVDTSFTRFTKGEIFGFTEFLSNTGGLLGLFMGFSFMSIVEILYFITLRMLCGLYRQRRTAVAAAEVYPYQN